MEIYARSNQRRSRGGGNPAALSSRLRGNDGMLIPAARLIKIQHFREQMREGCV